jgi:hypothetical protein
MKLSRLEEDLVGDLAQDDHGLWEVFQFVRLHSPSLTDEEVFQAGRDLIASWSERGWLEVVDASGVGAASSLVGLVDQLGQKALEASEAAPLLRLSKVGRSAIDWLS